MWTAIAGIVASVVALLGKLLPGSAPSQDAATLDTVAKEQEAGSGPTGDTPTKGSLTDGTF